MALTLTKRQQVLFDRLVTLGEWASSGALPMDVLEIRGFGSFFRGKATPKDVDLLVRCDHHPPRPDFARFLKIVDEVQYDPAFRDGFGTPREAMLVKYKLIDQPRLPGMDHGEIECKRFAEWIDGFSWNMLHPQTLQQEVAVKSPTYFAKRMIKRQLPNLSIVDFLTAGETGKRGFIRCGFTVTIWSMDQPDIRTNLKRLLAEESVVENTRRDVAYFEMQHPMLHAKVNLLQAEVELLLVMPRELRAVEDEWKWLKGWSEKQDSLRPLKEVVRQCEAAAHRFDHEEWGADELPKTVRNLSYRHAAAKADELRKELKVLYQTMGQLEDIRGKLALLQSGGARTTLSPKEFVVSEIMNMGSARARQKAADFLREIGFL